VFLINKGVYIPSIDGKDLFVSNHLITENPTGYSIRNNQNQYNLNKFINTLDYSLDLLKLEEVYYKAYRKNGFKFKVGKHFYSSQVINVTFKYSNKEYNLIRGNTYVKFGYDVRDLEFTDCACVINNELIGIVVGQDVAEPVSSKLLGKCFKFIDGHYQVGTIRTINTRFEIREDLYKNGFICDGIRYVRFKRSSGSARVGKCLFINEKLYKAIHKWEMWGLNIEEGQELDLAAFESYISLTTSSIIDTLRIDPKSILVIDDYESVFNEEVEATVVKDGTLHTEQKTTTITNSIWDRQSLIDKSVLGKYENCGMVLLRNGFFKSCCFNTNIQKWFSDNNITEINQLNGETLAENVYEIKLITTPSSIKYLKFGSLWQWLDNIDPNFGLVKTDKKTHYFEGKLVQCHYQLLSTLQLSYEEVEKFLDPTLTYINLLNSDPAVLRYQIKYPYVDEEVAETKLVSKNDVVFKLLGLNDRFANTKYYQDFKTDLLQSFMSNVRRGHVLINGNYSTLLGNPVEMLQSAIGQFNGESILGVGNIHSRRFKYGCDLLGSRSPHVAFGNILVATNVSSEILDEYFNLTEEIVAINSIGENILERLSGADFDSDTIMLTDNEILLSAAKRNYHRFKTPTNLVGSRKTVRYYTPEQLADLDIKTSVNKIGEIVNLSQILNNLYWDNVAHGQSHEENHELYCDIAQLDVLSNLAIDSAKREFPVDITAELSKLRRKYAEVLTDEKTGKSLQPNFFSHISKLKGYYNPEKKLYAKQEATMDYIQTVMNKFRRTGTGHKYYPQPFVTVLDDEKYNPSLVNKEQLKMIVDVLENYGVQKKRIWSTEDMSRSNKMELIQLEKQKCTDIIDQKRIGYSTMYTLLSLIDDPNYTAIKNILVEVLFQVPNRDFYACLKESKEDVPRLYQDENGNLEILGVKFSRVPEEPNTLYIQEMREKERLKQLEKTKPKKRKTLHRKRIRSSN